MFSTLCGPMSIIFGFIPIFDLYKWNWNMVSKKIHKTIYKHIPENIKYKNNGYSLSFIKDICKNKNISSKFINFIFKSASAYGYLKLINNDISDDNNYAIRWASIYGHFEIVRLLLKDPRVDPSDNNNYAIQWASERGHFEIVKLLLKDSRVDPSDNNNCAIRWASESGHLEIVRLLLEDLRVKNTYTKFYN